jgi:hypothetical protein
MNSLVANWLVDASSHLPEPIMVGYDCKKNRLLNLTCSWEKSGDRISITVQCLEDQKIKSLPMVHDIVFVGWL